MATTVHMPEVLTGVTEAAVQSWLVEVGQTVAVGTPLAEIETDKAVVEYAAEVAGVILRVLVAPGDPVAIGDAILIIGEHGEQVHEPDGYVASAESVGSTAAAAPRRQGEGPMPDPPVAATTDRGSRIIASPLVHRLARERGLELDSIVGSGPRGRIVRRDLERHVERDVTLLAPASGHETPPSLQAHAEIEPQTGYEDVPVTSMRRAIARRLTESTSTVPHFFVEAECRVDELIELRRRVNEGSDLRVSLNDFVIKAVAGALIEVPEANAIWQEKTIRRFAGADIAVAVAVDGGLVTPVLRGVERLSLSQTSTALADLAERARAGSLRQHEIEGGAFSVSNLGMFGVGAFSAIINPPHAGILAVGAARRVPLVVDDAVQVGSVMTVTLSADHRVVDGAVAARWLGAFVRRIENPLSMLI
ncbi:dihydrolipoamide acetyltransferase family protein [Microbacterium sp. 18062]|uniref:dihydrolipoamide acetyltransferase family protein n=1 Tax=Microbacterium sp. 18062 TaxID=2681410 RepID=UPI00135C8991|nr:dihydrolipoamide acetyltransferase family protein [Microbacterium sp. 18062]